MVLFTPWKLYISLYIFSSFFFFLGESSTNSTNKRKWHPKRWKFTKCDLPLDVSAKWEWHRKWDFRAQNSIHISTLYIEAAEHSLLVWSTQQHMMTIRIHTTYLCWFHALCCLCCVILMDCELSYHMKWQ